MAHIATAPRPRGGPPVGTAIFTERSAEQRGSRPNGNNGEEVESPPHGRPAPSTAGPPSLARAPEPHRLFLWSAEDPLPTGRTLGIVPSPLTGLEISEPLAVLPSGGVPRVMGPLRHRARPCLNLSCLCPAQRRRGGQCPGSHVWFLGMILGLSPSLQGSRFLQCLQGSRVTKQEHGPVQAIGGEARLGLTERVRVPPLEPLAGESGVRGSPSHVASFLSACCRSPPLVI